MLLPLNTEDDRARLLQHIRAFDLESGRYDVTIEPHRPGIKLTSRRRFEAMVGEIAKHTGEDRGVLREYIKARFIGMDENTIAGEKIQTPISTKTLVQSDFVMLIQNVEAWAVTEFNMGFTYGQR